MMLILVFAVNEMMHLIYVGRLTKEKGFEEVLDLCQTIMDEGWEMQLDVFGDGDLRPILESRLSLWSHATYHGHQPKQAILSLRKQANLTLMPSHFLETFGLTALDSLRLGVPVVGYNKGGLEQFGDGMVTIESSLVDTVRQIVQRTVSLPLSADCTMLAARYSVDAWFERFVTASGLSAGSTVLLINDYACDMGGIENRLGLVQQKLSQEGYRVVWYGKSTKSYGWRRQIDLFGTIANIPAWYSLRRIIRREQPDLVWCHSVHRWLGWLPLILLGRGSTCWMMFHDMGMIHPYPSQVMSESMLTASGSFWSFWRCAAKPWRMMPLLFAKWCSLSLIFFIIRDTEHYRVPSPYMEHFFSDRVGDNVNAMPLFVEDI